MIKVRYSSIDGCNRTATFGSVARARVWAEEWIGKAPTCSTTFQYAVSDDGIGKIEVSGCMIEELFPDG